MSKKTIDLEVNTSAHRPSSPIIEDSSSFKSTKIFDAGNEMICREKFSSENLNENGRILDVDVLQCTNGETTQNAPFVDLCSVVSAMKNDSERNCTERLYLNHFDMSKEFEFFDKNITAPSNEMAHAEPLFQDPFSESTANQFCASSQKTSGNDPILDSNSTNIQQIGCVVSKSASPRSTRSASQTSFPSSHSEPFYNRRNSDYDKEHITSLFDEGRELFKRKMSMMAFSTTNQTKKKTSLQALGLPAVNCKLHSNQNSSSDIWPQSASQMEFVSSNCLFCIQQNEMQKRQKVATVESASSDSNDMLPLNPQPQRRSLIFKNAIFPLCDEAIESMINSTPSRESDNFSQNIAGNSLDDRSIRRGKVKDLNTRYTSNFESELSPGLQSQSANIDCFSQMCQENGILSGIYTRSPSPTGPGIQNDINSSDVTSGSQSNDSALLADNNSLSIDTTELKLNSKNCKKCLQRLKTGKPFFKTKSNENICACCLQILFQDFSRAQMTKRWQYEAQYMSNMLCEDSSGIFKMSKNSKIGSEAISSEACTAFPIIDGSIQRPESTLGTNNSYPSRRPSSARADKICFCCKTSTTPLWRKDHFHNNLCNACGLYYKIHGKYKVVFTKPVTQADNSSGALCAFFEGENPLTPSETISSSTPPLKQAESAGSEGQPVSKRRKIRGKPEPSVEASYEFALKTILENSSLPYFNRICSTLTFDTLQKLRQSLQSMSSIVDNCLVQVGHDQYFKEFRRSASMFSSIMEPPFLNSTVQAPPLQVPDKHKLNIAAGSSRHTSFEKNASKIHLV